MRTLFTLGVIVTAMLVPWSSLAPMWLPDAAGSSISPSLTKKSTGPSARLNAALGIMPLSQEKSAEKSNDSHTAYEFADGRRVLCENGVCRVVDDLAVESAVPVALGEGELDSVAREERLKSLGATQLHLERGSDGDDSRVACFVPVVSGSKVLRRFEASGATDCAALTRLVEQIETWLQDRQ